MAGVFHFGDCLVLQPMRFTQMRPGDVLVYRRNSRKGEEEYIVHRALKFTGQGWVVQGDRNARPDALLVNQEHFIGIVSHVIRNGKKVRLAGGASGLFYARIYHIVTLARLYLWRFMRLVGRRGYSWIRETNMVGRIWRPEVKKIYVITEKGLLIKYVIGNHVVARAWPEQERFECRKPWDLVIRDFSSA